MVSKTIPAEKLPRLMAEGALVIDVRTPAEFNAVHVRGSQLHPLNQLNCEAMCSELGAETPIYILCQSDKRATMAAEKLSDAGHHASYVVEGGINAALSTDVDIIRGKGVISIERQVRIAAGALVALGALASALIHPGFIWLPVFVGCGLVFAGITDTCGMGMMLAKMPWNK